MHSNGQSKSVWPRVCIVASTTMYGWELVKVGEEYKEGEHIDLASNAYSQV